MPNYVKTRVKFLNITDDQFDGVIDKYAKHSMQGYTIDFEKIIPMPDGIYRGDLGQKEQEMYGDKNWYDWSCKNWGTKWNAFDGSVNEDMHQMEFCTAWSFAFPVINELAKQTGFEIEAIYADEDFGYNVGMLQWKDGKYEEQLIIENSDAAWDIVWELWGVTRDDLEEAE